MIVWVAGSASGAVGPISYGILVPQVRLRHPLGFDAYASKNLGLIRPAMDLDMLPSAEI